MLRKLMIGAPVACLLALTGCAGMPGSGGSDGNPPFVIPSPASFDPQVAAVRDWTNRLCGVVPTVGTVLSVIATFTGGGAIVDAGRQIGAGICSTVMAKGARRGAGPPRYRGVVIRLESR